jgi:hypothetical protein
VKAGAGGERQKNTLENAEPSSCPGRDDGKTFVKRTISFFHREHPALPFDQLCRGTARHAQNRLLAFCGKKGRPGVDP